MFNKRDILCIDDEQHVLDLLTFSLKAQGYEVYTATNGNDGLRKARKMPSLILLDLTLPDMDGTEVCRQLKATPLMADIPILIVSARDNETDRVRCFDLGADDYITKPFSTKELIFRVESILRSNMSAVTGIITIGSLRIDTGTDEVFQNGEKLKLTQTEYRLLKLLASHPEKLFTRELLLDCIWDHDFRDGTRVVDMHIRNLRQKLRDGKALIQTVWRIGYRIRVPQKTIAPSGEMNFRQI